MRHGLSGTACLRPSGTASSDHREPKPAATRPKSAAHAALNLANQESSGFLLTPPACEQFTADAAPAACCPQADAGTDKRHLTRVDLLWEKGVREHWLRFGKPVAQRIFDRHRRAEYYAPGQAFAFVRWASNAHGTTHSSLVIVRALPLGEPCTRIANVAPGGDVLLAVSGWRKVRQVLQLIDGIGELAIDPCDVAPDHWHHIHNRIAAADHPRRYTRARHGAWLARKALLP